MFGGDPSIGFFYIQAATALVLILAANTAFNGFPLLGSVLAQDRFMPRQLHTRGDKLVFSNGILLLAGFAMLLIVAFDADVTRLIQLYIIGVFTSFSIGQWGMVRHWNREMRPSATRRCGADAPVADDQHPRRVADQRRPGDHRDHEVHPRRLAGAGGDADALRADEVDQQALLARRPSSSSPTATRGMLPSKVHAVVLVSKVHKPTLRALAFARATRPDELTALTVNVDDADTRRCRRTGSGSTSRCR